MFYKPEEDGRLWLVALMVVALAVVVVLSAWFLGGLDWPESGTQPAR